MDIVRWIAAFQDMALAAAATEVRQPVTKHAHCSHITRAQTWNYTASTAHLRICMEIAANAKNEHRTGVLAQVYDEVCRKEWAERAFRGKYD